MTNYEDLGEETREMVEENAEKLPDHDPLGNDVVGDPDTPAVEGGGRGAGI